MLKRLQLHRTDRWLPILFFSALLLIGIVIHRDYGLSWDDPIQRQLGLDTWDYILGKNDHLFQNWNCYINPLVALLEALPEKILQPKSERAIYMSHHLVNFIFCWIGLIFFYLLALRLFGDYRFALLATLMLVLMPRLFAHYFYNSKDLPFLFLFVLNVYLLTAWIQRPSWGKIVWMVIGSGILSATRVAGMLFPVIVVLAIAVGLFTHQLKRKEMKMIFAYIVLYPLSVYIFFPTIWHDPLAEFLKAIALYSHHPSDVTTFFMGETIHSLNTPWYYIPVWMAITVPLGWWLFFLAGLIVLGRIFFQKRTGIPLLPLIIILWLLIPLASVTILRANLYEDGRHLFFIEPAFLLIGVFGIQKMLQIKFSTAKIFSRLSLIAAVVVFLFTSVSVMASMIMNHPHQHSYFNALGRKYAFHYFDKDYWGLSYRNALEFLVKYHPDDHLNVRWQIDPGEINLVWLDDYDRQRIHHAPYDQCDYYITNYRSHPPEDASDEKIYDVKVQGITIVAIYKMDPPKGSPDAPP